MCYPLLYRSVAAPTPSLCVVLHTNTYLSCSQLITHSGFGQPPRCGSREEEKKTAFFSLKIRKFTHRLNNIHPGLLLLCKGHLAKKSRGTDGIYMTIELTRTQAVPFPLKVPCV